MIILFLLETIKEVPLNTYLYFYQMIYIGDANADSVTGGGLWYGKNLTDAVERGDVSEERVIIFFMINDYYYTW